MFSGFGVYFSWSIIDDQFEIENTIWLIIISLICGLFWLPLVVYLIIIRPLFILLADNVTIVFDITFLIAVYVFKKKYLNFNDEAKFEIRDEVLLRRKRQRFRLPDRFIENAFDIAMSK
jgi:hypothetical protein